MRRAGGPEVLEVREAPAPEPGAGRVLVRVGAAGVNFADILARQGLYPDAPPPPAVLGYEVAGEVEAIGAGVSGLAPGDRVAALTPFGGYSERVAVASETVFPLPASLSLEQGAALPVNYLMAWLMLVRIGNVQRGERVLVHAVAGGVGQAALQIARHRGAEVLGTAGAGKHGRLREQGVARCIDYRREDFESAVARLTGGAGVDRVLDGIGGETLVKSYRCLAPMGQLFAFGTSSLTRRRGPAWLTALRARRRSPVFDAAALMSDSRGVVGVNLGHLVSSVPLMRRMMDEILQLAADGTFSPTLDRAFPFDEAADAHRYIEERRNFGKVLLAP